MAMLAFMRGVCFMTIGYNGAMWWNYAPKIEPWQFKLMEMSGAEQGHREKVAFQICKLVNKVRHFCAQQGIILEENDQAENINSLLVPAAVFGAAGFAYMWFEGYVTKENLANSVSSTTKHLKQVSANLVADMRNLMERTNYFGGILDEQKAISTTIKNELTDVRKSSWDPFAD